MKKKYKKYKINIPFHPAKPGGSFTDLNYLFPKGINNRAKLLNLCPHIADYKSHPLVGNLLQNGINYQGNLLTIFIIIVYNNIINFILILLTNNILNPIIDISYINSPDETQNIIPAKPGGDNGASLPHINYITSLYPSYAGGDLCSKREISNNKYYPGSPVWDNVKNKGPSIFSDIWVYNVNTTELINNKPYSSKIKCSEDLNITRGTILKYLNLGELYKDKYLFSYIELTKEQIQAKCPMTNIVLETITGELLGDGHLRRGTKTARLNFTFSKDILYYVEYLKFNVLSSICNSTKPTPWPKNNPTQYWFSSKSTLPLLELHNQWYKLDKISNKYIKVLPPNIENLLTPRAIAHWLMGDGWWDNNSIKFSTDNFTLEEVQLLINILKNKYDINCTINKCKRHYDDGSTTIQYRIRVGSKEVNKLIDLIQIYVLPKMLYKLGKGN